MSNQRSKTSKQRKPSTKYPTLRRTRKTFFRAKPLDTAEDTVVSALMDMSGNLRCEKSLVMLHVEDIADYIERLNNEYKKYYSALLSFVSGKRDRFRFQIVRDELEGKDEKEGLLFFKEKLTEKALSIKLAKIGFADPADKKIKVYPSNSTDKDIFS